MTTSAFTWKRGSPAKMTESSSSIEIAARDHASTTSFAWVCAASLGVPVVPPVWKSAAMSLGSLASSPWKAAIRLCRCRFGEEDDPGRIGVVDRLRRDRSEQHHCFDPDGAGDRRREGPQPGSIPGPAHTSTWAPDRLRSSTMCSALSPALIGAATPATCAASVAVISSAPLGASRATASPRRTPSECNRFAVRVTSASSSA